jgi:Domain of unknown function (DUF4314)
MDAKAAQLLAARIRAGVPIGSTIELVDDLGDELHAGDRGIVRDINIDGVIVVRWEAGFTSEIDPGEASFRKLAA